MKVSLKSFLTFAIVLALTLSMNIAFGQDKMTKEDYQQQLGDYQTREENAKKAAEECATETESIKGEIENVKGETEKVWSEILEAIGTDQAGVDAYSSELKALERQVDGLLALSPEELFKKRDEIKAAEEKLAELKTNRVSALTEMQNMIANIEGKLTQLKNKMPKAVYDPYTVVVGDYLWKISGKEEIYDDPIQWMRIYSYNKDQIKDPDLIYPEQVLKIQREVGPDEYLVAKGDYLAKIAGNPEVMDDPAKWAKVYEKNKEIIGEDPNLIFPYTVLVIPRD